MENIVFVNQSASHPTKDIINAFAEKFQNVVLIAGSISETGNPLNKKVTVKRIIKYDRKTIFRRTITWTLATLQTIFLLNFKFRNYHLFLTSNPPLLTFVPLFCKNKYSVQILDIYPDALVSNGFIAADSWISKVWTKCNRRLFRRALNIFTITEGMANTLSKYCNKDKIKVISQWPSFSKFDKVERSRNEFIKSNNLQNNFIIMYSGNIGLGHHVDVLVEIADKLKNHKDILLIIIGEGWNKAHIERLIQEHKLQNCRLLPYQPEGMFRHSIQAADIGVVGVSKEVASLAVPIKTYNLIMNEIPLLCITEGNSELTSLVNKFDIGKCFPPDQIDEMVEYILKLRKESAAIMRYKANLRECAKYFSPENAYLYVNDFKS